MKLSEIVAYLNLLESLDIGVECDEAMRRMAAVYHVIETHQIQIKSHTRELKDGIDSINHFFGKFSNSLDQLKQYLRQQVADQQSDYFRKSMENFQHAYETSDYILNRRLKIDDEAGILLKSKLRNLSDWRLPGLIFRPGLEDHIEHMVPLDPLYLIDQRQDLLSPAVNKFTPEYQRRLREYVIDDQATDPILEQLPNNQFGFVFAYNYFNYKPMEVLNKYITELAAKLRPGGTMLMTYNNCDRAHGVALAERAWMMYQPKNLIIAHIEKSGLEVVEAYDGLGDLSWLEITKPGNIETLRGGQALAKIVAVPQ